MTVRAPLGPLLRAFFADHLLQQKAVSPQTIHAYRDAFRLLLTFLKQHRQRKLGISEDVDRRFRRNWITDFGGSGSPIPVEVDRFRRKWITRFPGVLNARR